MRFLTRARYALWMMLEVARADNRIIPLGKISQKTRISRRYLEQLATAFKRARLLRGRSGRCGGYELTRAPSEVRVGEIIETAIGPINVVECVQEPSVCMMANACECREVYERVNQKIIEVLNEITLADLMQKEPSRDQFTNLTTKTLTCPTR